MSRAACQVNDEIEYYATTAAHPLRTRPEPTAAEAEAEASSQARWPPLQRATSQARAVELRERSKSVSDGGPHAVRPRGECTDCTGSY